MPEYKEEKLSIKFVSCPCLPYDNWLTRDISQKSSPVVLDLEFRTHPSSPGVTNYTHPRFHGHKGLYHVLKTFVILHEYLSTSHNSDY